MKKVLIVISCLGVGGGERSLINLLNEFDYTKYKVDLITLNDSGLLGKQIPESVNVLKKDTKLNHLFPNTITHCLAFQTHTIFEILCKCCFKYFSLH